MSTARILPNAIPPLVLPNPVTGYFTGNFQNFPHPDSICEFLNITMMPALLSMLSGQKYAPKTTGYVDDEYDFVIVGAGAAGCVLANRLSELRNMKVLLLENGGAPPYLSEIPGVARGLVMTDTNYGYYSEPQKACAQQLHEKRIPYTAGRGIGGSSLINAMLYIRGHCKDYDKWAEMGATNWSCKDVMPYFHRLENNTDLDFLENGCHSTGGPMTAGRARHVSKFRPVLLEAAKSLGWKVNVDPNCGNQQGISDHQTFTRRGLRCSAAKAYLVPVDHRKNLHIVSHAFVTKIEISPKTKRAERVCFDWRKKGATRCVKARQKVIISAGALNSPKLLMLSGIGPKEILQKLGIPLILDLPVGKNFQDHFSSILCFYLQPTFPKIYTSPSFLLQLINPLNILRYATDASGPLASPTGVYGMGFNRSRDASTDPDVPNYELYFMESDHSVLRLTFGLKPEVYEALVHRYRSKTPVWCVSSTTNPKDKGDVWIDSKDPYEPPKIDPKFLEHEEDLNDVVAGLMACWDIAETPAMRAAGVRVFETVMPGCEESFSKSREEYLRCYVKSFGFTIGHQSCTVKMGSESDPTAVVTPDLRVKGTKNLYVVDASVMPAVVSGNLMIPTLMIGEKAADMMKKDYQGGT